MPWFPKAVLPIGIALFTLSLVISACERSQPPAGTPNSSADAAAGAVLFAAHCALCHGANGDGQGARRAFMDPSPANLMLPPWSQKANAARTFAAIRHGVRGTAMAPWPNLSEEQVADLVAYIQTLKR